ncbi:PREDICTED: LOW QUALITY PROTEIN: protein Hook homolog 3-like [Priapulus caudatus]|uniref:Protein hook n=1 Tax=Priapulus caudatus TaxID=37621 RepID=A0ABM1EQE8_PRICU|nr:PREDICTED: LOW QUALITY PROTEIN: protein Hook homolog 3-like [Priapulus caudatus]
MAFAFSQLQTFDVETEFDSITSLSDGVIMSEVLMQIAPGFFNEEWKSKIKVDVEVSNKRIKISNLKKILKGILDYYSQVLGQQIIDFPMPDVSLIGEFGDSMELGKLLQLILGCAVNCQNKEEYIQYIMGMDEDVQQYIMKAIQELMNKEVPAPPGASETGDTQNQLKETWQALQEAVQAKEELLLRCGELDVQLASIQEEKIGLTVENQRLQEKIHMSEQLLDEDSSGGSSTAAERKYQHLQAKVDNFQDELYRLENVCQDQRIKLELQEKEILDVQLKNESLVKLADEARSLKDEVDILRHNSEKALQYELSIDTYKKKLEEMGDVKRQLKLLEEKNTNYVQSSMEMEEELRKAQSFRTQVERYKKEIHELHPKLSEESKRADRLDFDNKRHHEKTVPWQPPEERWRLVTMRDSLSETNEELRMMLLQSGADQMQLVESP